METWLKECRDILMDGGKIKINNQITVDQFLFNDKFYVISNEEEYLNASFNKIIDTVVYELLSHHFEEYTHYCNEQLKAEAAISDYEFSKSAA